MKLTVERVTAETPEEVLIRWGFWYNALDGVIYGSFILAAKILWHLIDFGQSFYTATQLNEQIRQRKLEERNKEDAANG